MDWKKKLEEAANRVEQARDIDKEYAGKEMPADKAEQIGKLLDEADALKKQADQAKRLDDAAKWADEPQRKHPHSLDGKDGDQGKGEKPDERKEAQRGAFFKAMREGKGALSREEKALVEDTNGEILVPEELEAEIYRSLPKLTVIRELATVRTISSDRMRRRSLTEVSVGWGKLETAAQTLTDSMPSTPTDEYQYVEDLYGLAKIGEDELMDTDVSLQAFVSDSFGRAIGETADTGFVIGTGHASNQPEGILNGTVVTRVPAGQIGAITTDDFISLAYAVPAQYRKNGSYIVASTTEKAMRLLKASGTGNYLWQPSLQAGRPNSFDGRPVYNQEDVPAIPASGTAGDVGIFGDIRAGYRILDRLGMTIKVLDQLYSEDGLIGYRAHFRVTGGVIRADALRVLNVPAA